MLLNNDWVNNDIKEEIKILLSWEKQRWTNNLQSVGHSKSNPKSSNTGRPQETRKILNKQSSLTPKGTRKRVTHKAQSE